MNKKKFKILPSIFKKPGYTATTIPFFEKAYSNNQLKIAFRLQKENINNDLFNLFESINKDDNVILVNIYNKHNGLYDINQNIFLFGFAGKVTELIKEDDLLKIVLSDCYYTTLNDISLEKDNILTYENEEIGLNFDKSHLQFESNDDEIDFIAYFLSNFKNRVLKDKKEEFLKTDNPINKYVDDWKNNRNLANTLYNEHKELVYDFLCVMVKDIHETANEHFKESLTSRDLKEKITFLEEEFIYNDKLKIDLSRHRNNNQKKSTPPPFPGFDFSKFDLNNFDLNNFDLNNLDLSRFGFPSNNNTKDDNNNKDNENTQKDDPNKGMMSDFMSSMGMGTYKRKFTNSNVESGKIRTQDLINDDKKCLEVLNSLPEAVRYEVDDLLARYQSTMGPDKNIAATRVEIIVNFPWNKKWEFNTTLKDVKSKLDLTHKGLEDVKRKILSQLVVTMKTGEALKETLCLVGAPGVGKTSIALAIADALDRPIYKISLNGQSQEVLIRGMNQAYAGAKYGQVVKAFVNSQVINPIIVFDEVDKLAEGGLNTGSARDALLELFDPSQAFIFRDNFMDVDIDISQALFICTANYLDQIPESLISRLSIIHLDSYLPNEKLEITKYHLLHEVEVETGYKLELSDEMILYIIKEFTHEGGVRKLKQKLISLASDLLLDEEYGIKAPKKIDKEFIRKYLKPSEAVIIKNRIHDVPGQMNGLYYSTAGGGVMKIFTTPIYTELKNNEPAKITITATGNLKKVIEESTKVALIYLQKYIMNNKKFKLDKNIEFKVHFQNGATPKDGPSAGGAIFMSILSAFTGQIINNKYAMTGEITPVGNITAIGGLREKLYGAADAGCINVFIPKENEGFVKEQINKKILEKLNVNFVEHIEEVIKVIFPNFL